MSNTLDTLKDIEALSTTTEQVERLSALLSDTRFQDSIKAAPKKEQAEIQGRLSALLETLQNHVTDLTSEKEDAQKSIDSARENSAACFAYSKSSYTHYDGKKLKDS